MADKALRGNRLTKQRRMERSSAPKEEMTSNEALGVFVTGGLKGKPHSTKEGREASGQRHVKRFFSQFKKKKGTSV
tara:strand:- start:274 stop:501 length:228 start_codon:yes stop_codon:yes gene_type:complete